MQKRSIGSLLLASLFFLASCGEDKKTETKTTTYTFATDIQPILRTSCAGASTCHNSSASESGTDYVNSRSAFVAAATTVKTRINATDSTVMPEVNSGKTLSSENKTIIENYLAQSTRN